MASNENLELDYGLAALPDPDQLQMPRKSGLQLKIPPEHAEFLNGLRRERLGADLKKSDAIIEDILTKIQTCGVVRAQGEAKK
jgi:hypothetical protein